MFCGWLFAWLCVLLKALVGYVYVSCLGVVLVGLFGCVLNVIAYT